MARALSAASVPIEAESRKTSFRKLSHLLGLVKICDRVDLFHGLVIIKPFARRLRASAAVTAVAATAVERSSHVHSHRGFFQLALPLLKLAAGLL